uniref:Uncharacterized protein n=1 Tax=Anguilla anguilla TaxID=7936 RepID=A0A0E9WS55_ANGAN
MMYVTVCEGIVLVNLAFTQINIPIYNLKVTDPDSYSVAA